MMGTRMASETNWQNNHDIHLCADRAAFLLLWREAVFLAMLVADPVFFQRLVLPVLPPRPKHSVL